jgi:hypothetical protein
MAAYACVEGWERTLDGPPNGEARMLRPLLEWLTQTRRITGDTHIALELAWFGRHIDLATLTRTRRTVAYELKLGSLGRALEQASYNRLAFDRSYVVTESIPKEDNLALAADAGIGLIVVRAGKVRCLLESPMQRPTPELRGRLLAQLRSARCAGDV